LISFLNYKNDIISKLLNLILVGLFENFIFKEILIEKFNSFVIISSIISSFKEPSLEMYMCDYLVYLCENNSTRAIILNQDFSIVLLK
jgi:hypothetical protein